MKVWNLTPHDIHYDDGQQQRCFPSDGTVRLQQTALDAAVVADLQTVHTAYGNVQGLPDGIQPGDAIIVSALVGQHGAALLPEGVTVLVPDTGPSCRRSPDGQIASVCRFIRIEKHTLS